MVCSSSWTRRSGCSRASGEAPIDIPPFVLDENIRNTKEIAQLFSSLSGEALKPRGMAGPKVRLYDVPSEAVLEVVDDVVESLLDEGSSPGRSRC